MKGWQLGVALLAGGAAFAIAFTATRSALGKPIGQAPKAPPSPPPTPAPPPSGTSGSGTGTGTGAGEPAAPGAGAGADATPSASGEGSPIPATALPYFVSGADGSYAYYVPAEAPQDRSDLFLPLNGPMTVGQTIGAVLAFVHAGPKGINKVSTLVPIEVTVDKIEDGHIGDASVQIITVRSSKSVLGSVEDALMKDVSLPSGVAWKVGNWRVLGIPTKAWFDQFSYGE